MNTDKEKLIYAMLTENTGIHMLDSGGGEGRGWQRNQKKTLTDFKKEPSVTWEKPSQGTSAEIEYTISLFHWLNIQPLELDELCDTFNAMPCEEWNSDVYGVSKKQLVFLLRHGLSIGDSWNSYNYNSALSQVIQGTNLHNEDNESNFEYPDYVLLQIHNGADVRGGYTDAKLFKTTDYFGKEDVYGTITRRDGETIEVENTQSANQNLESVDLQGPVAFDSETDELELYLANE